MVWITLLRLSFLRSALADEVGRRFDVTISSAGESKGGAAPLCAAGGILKGRIGTPLKSAFCLLFAA